MGRPKRGGTTPPRTFRFSPEIYEWLEAWASDHSTHVNGDPNITEAARMAIGVCMVIDKNEEYTEIINREFAGTTVCS